MSSFINSRSILNSFKYVPNSYISFPLICNHVFKSIPLVNPMNIRAASILTTFGDRHFRFIQQVIQLRGEKGVSSLELFDVAWRTFRSTFSCGWPSVDDDTRISGCCEALIKGKWCLTSFGLTKPLTLSFLKGRIWTVDTFLILITVLFFMTCIYFFQEQVLWWSISLRRNYSTALFPFHWSTSFWSQFRIIIVKKCVFVKSFLRWKTVVLYFIIPIKFSWLESHRQIILPEFIWKALHILSDRLFKAMTTVPLTNVSITTCSIWLIKRHTIRTCGISLGNSTFLNWKFSTTPFH